MASHGRKSLPAATQKTTPPSCQRRLGPSDCFLTRFLRFFDPFRSGVKLPDLQTLSSSSLSLSQSTPSILSSFHLSAGTKRGEYPASQKNFLKFNIPSILHNSWKLSRRLFGRTSSAHVSLYREILSRTIPHSSNTINRCIVTFNECLLFSMYVTFVSGN